jgi:diadenosine tetraphosphatase ApaH/serine/threonine PP2A family protein phosphatase
MRCAIISDIHGNFDALEAVLADAGDIDDLWCLGDLVGYGPEPNECIDLLRARSARCVAGNHDWAAIGKMDTSEFNPEASEAAQWTRARLTPEHHRFLESLPVQLAAGPQEEFTLVHGSPREPVWEYLTHLSTARLNFAYFQTPYCLVGHTHVPLVFQHPWPDDRAADFQTIVPEPGRALELGAHRLIVNPGSVGQPRDGNPDAAYMIYEGPDRELGRSVPGGAGGARGPRGTLTLRRVTYPVATVQQKMRGAGLPPRLIMRLTYGW